MHKYFPTVFSCYISLTENDTANKYKSKPHKNKNEQFMYLTKLNNFIQTYDRDLRKKR